MKIVTENFKKPAVVRGLFLNTPATELWKSADYLIGKIGHHKIDVVKNATINSGDGTQSNRIVLPLNEVITEIFGNSESKVLFSYL